MTGAIFAIAILNFILLWVTNVRIDKLKEELEVERIRINMLKIDVNYLWSELRNGEDNGGDE